MRGQNVTLEDLRQVVHRALGMGLTFKEFLAQVEPDGEVAVGYVTATWAACVGPDGRERVGHATEEEFKIGREFLDQQRKRRMSERIVTLADTIGIAHLGFIRMGEAEEILMQIIRSCAYRCREGSEPFTFKGIGLTQSSSLIDNAEGLRILVSRGWVLEVRRPDLTAPDDVVHEDGAPVVLTLTKSILDEIDRRRL